MKGHLYLLLITFLIFPFSPLFSNELEWKAKSTPISTKWGETFSPTNIHSAYPRPTLVRSEWLNLNGLWDYCINHRDAQTMGNPQGKILVPFPVESALSGVKRPLKAGQKLWYKRTFTVSPKWKSHRIMLNFGACDWKTSVFINGTKIGDHTGGYDNFSFDITTALKNDPAETNEIVVAVLDPASSGYQPRGKQNDSPKGTFYSSSSGIWQTVWLEPVPVKSITALEINPNLKDNNVSLIASTFKPGQEQALEAIIYANGKEVFRRKGYANQSLTIPIKEPILWSPESPFLYELKVTLQEGSRDSVNSYFAMREIGISTDGNKSILTLNGKMYFQLGALDHGYWPEGIYTAPNDEALKADILAAKRLGLNTLRKHVKVEPERWYYWCDKLGILVWQDIPTVHPQRLSEDSPDQHNLLKKTFEQELGSIVRQLKKHPSIVQWVIFNQGWSQFDEQRLTTLVKSIDQNRLVVTASGSDDKGAGDIVSLHEYPGPKTPQLNQNRPYVAGESGGFGLYISNNSWSKNRWSHILAQDIDQYKGMYQDFCTRINRLKRNEGLSGAIITQLTDVETEINGFLTYDRKAFKVDPDWFSMLHDGITSENPITKVE